VVPQLAGKEDWATERHLFGTEGVAGMEKAGGKSAFGVEKV